MSMPRFIIAPAAERDMPAILNWAHERFGETARRRYEALLACAIIDVANQPDRVGSFPCPQVAAGLRIYHVLHSRLRIPFKAVRVKTPRHFLLYRLRGDNQVEIGRVLHDSMDLKRHVLPDDSTTTEGQ